MEELVKWMPLIVTCVATLGASVTYIIQKHIDRKSTLNKIKQETYRALLSELFEQMSNNTGEPPHRLNALKGEAFLVASDEVSIAIGAFFPSIYKVSSEEKLQDSANDKSVEDMLENFAKMALAMRKDCFQKSNLSLQQVKKIMPFGYSSQTERVVSK